MLNDLSKWLVAFRHPSPQRSRPPKSSCITHTSLQPKCYDQYIQYYEFTHKGPIIIVEKYAAQRQDIKKLLAPLKTRIHTTKTMPWSDELEALIDAGVLTGFALLTVCADGAFCVFARLPLSKAHDLKTCHPCALLPKQKKGRRRRRAGDGAVCGRPQCDAAAVGAVLLQRCGGANERRLSRCVRGFLEGGRLWGARFSPIHNTNSTNQTKT